MGETLAGHNPGIGIPIGILGGIRHSTKNPGHKGSLSLRVGFCAVFALTACFTFLLPAKADHDEPVVVELFTSQSCAHCPAADELASDLAQRKDVLLLSFPVDYWDHLGWKDTLARPDFTSRQEAHAASLGLRQLYTPQMIVNGEIHAVGNRRQEVESAIQNHGSTGRPLSASMKREGEVLVISAAHRVDGAGEVPKSAVIWLAGYVGEYKISIAGGENGGQEVRYTNVVRNITAIGAWEGETLNLTLPLEEHARGHDGLAVLIQDDSGRIVGMAHLALH